MERYFTTSYPLVFAWGLLVLLGLIGLGKLVARLVDSEVANRAGWGLHAVWGVAIYLFVGGLLAAVDAFGEIAILLLIGAGLAALIWMTFRGPRPTRAFWSAWPGEAWPAFAVAAFTYAAGVSWPGNLNLADDFPCYHNLCEKLLATGSFDEPFSWRRLASLGGHTVLQSSVLARGSYANVQAFEVGLCPLILLGLVLGFRGGMLARSPLGLVLAFIAITTPIIRVNTASHLTTTVLLLGLFATLDLIAIDAARRRRWLIVAGLIAAACCSLRAQGIAAACGALGLFWLANWWSERQPARRAFEDAACWGGALLLALLPWMIMGWRSNGSLLFPLFPGGNNLAFNPQGIAGPVYERLKWPVQMLLSATLLPLLLCLIAIPRGRRTMPARAVAAAVIFTSLLLAYGLGLAPDEWTIPRYVQPLLLAAALAALLTAACSSRGRAAAWALSALLLVAHLPERANHLWMHYLAFSVPEKALMPFSKSVIADYREAQLLVPEGARILVCGDFPFLFDHARNPIWSIDLPHATSPAPSLPFRQSPEETKRYLHGLGIDYVIAIDFAKSVELYNRATWQKHAEGSVALWKIQAPFFLDFFDIIDRLRASEEVRGQVGSLTTLRLRQ